MWNGIAIGIGRQRFAGGFADSYSARVLANGGTIEALSCVAGASVLLQTASLLLIPSGYKAGVAYSALPNNGNGDLTWSRNSVANRIQSDGNIGSVGANVPRLSYMYGSCPSLLLEPQRTNLVLNSEDFSNAYWTKLDSTISTNATTSPSGTLTADKLIDDNDNITHYVTNIGNFTIGTTYTLSIYAKAAERNWIAVGFNNQSNSIAWFNLSNGTLGTVQSNISATSIQSVGNGWYRCSITSTATVLNPYPSFIVANADNILAYPGDGLSGIFIWGAQMEDKPYATTYIPTTTATATRLADVFTRNNIYTNGLISASGGTWYIELKNNIEYIRDAIGSGIGLGDTTAFSSGNCFTIRNGNITPSELEIFKRVNNNISFIYQSLPVNAKIAIKWNGSTADVFVNGIKVVSATAFTGINMENLGAPTIHQPVFIQQMALFNTPLSDANCQLLTT
jgi:hypothetical protein